ncbi:hypothetical protein DYU05_04010 [Mucilaginibacter terrenus]|uniref:Uncharacterized protein n=1 Tax=Mucilaginibacter terrenus TaxID=2482727 RepID=A0A3E2NVA0_9SPHI|nr:hypothetical protein [Mucilaginibacter terrenus]RFZ84780.1 hypothetical protein DYU05_04010 [Mucilaginibacter terrenus]
MTIENQPPLNNELPPQGPEPDASQGYSAPAPAALPRNRFATVEEPKNKQFTGRATEREYNRINSALAARKQDGRTYDIVRLCLDMLDHIEDDILQSFTTK